MTSKIHQRALLVSGGGLVGVILISAILWIVFHKSKPVSQPKPSPTISAQLRAISDSKFGPRARTQTAANVDVGIHYYTSTPKPTATPTPKSSKSAAPVKVTSTAYPSADNQQPLETASPGATPRILATPKISPSVQPAPLPILTPPTFTALPNPSIGSQREIAIIYAKGAEGKRQIYLRSIERDKDQQLVTSVFDDFGVSFSSTSQRVAFYSDEQGPSDATHFRSKLKVLDVTTGKVTQIAEGLPAAWPASWSPDGQRLAIPTANSIFISDTSTGASLQVPTGREPGGLIWSPDGKQIAYQSKTADNSNFDLFLADATTAQAKPLVAGVDDERYLAWSADGKKFSFIRNKTDNAGTGGIVNVRDVGSDRDVPITTSQPTISYLFDLKYSQLLFVRSGSEPQLNLYKDSTAKAVGNLRQPKLISWDRDYDHVFLLASEADSQTLYSVTIATGAAEKIKSGIAGFNPPTH